MVDRIIATVVNSRWTYLAFACLNVCLSAVAYSHRDMFLCIVDVFGAVIATFLFFRIQKIQSR